MLDRLGAGRESLGDLDVAQPISQEWENLKFTISQPLRIGARSWMRPTGKAARATLAEPPPDDLDCGRRAQPLEDGEGDLKRLYVAI